MGGFEGSTLLLIWVAIMVGIWLWSSSRRKSQERQRSEFLSSLRPGDRVVTVGGIFGRVEGVQDDQVRLEVAPGVVISMHRLGINTLADD